MLSPAEENALRIYIAKLETENAVMRKLNATEGFYEEYFKALKTAPSNKSAFDTLNENYFRLFGRYRYSDYDAFRTVMNRNNKKTK